MTSGSVARPFPLGVSAPLPSASGDTANVAVFAPDHHRIVLWVQAPERSWRRVLLPHRSEGVHYGLVPGIPRGSRYALAPAGAAPVGESESTPDPDSARLPFGADQLDSDSVGPDPDSAQLLLDPYGKYIDCRPGPDGPLYTSVRVADGSDGVGSEGVGSDGVGSTRAGGSTGADFDWGTDAPPRTPWRNTVLYEAHVKGQTMRSPMIPEAIRGSYAGMAHPAMIEHLTALGITVVELLPIQYHIDEPHLAPLGLTNYWGYNTLGFFAPHVHYASAAARTAGPEAVRNELKAMVKALHSAGIEVLLDVVYNHTAEGPAALPDLSWRGLADEQYYRHEHGRYLDNTGCGNTMDFSEPRVVDLVLESLRYWVKEFHVDGFRFDLAVSLARDGNNHFRQDHAFLAAASADPGLQGVKLIAEPWDLGPDGWQTGCFPAGWSDWNDRFRDSVRDIWLTDQAAMAAGGHGGPLAPLADALAGSSALFAASGRGHFASINLITAHDGFTLADLVSYSHKHNEANGEDNRDGGDHNHSWNHGVEGRTDDPGIRAARAQSSRNMMATLMLSQGVPMITAGDELGRSQQGNNNTYCQDNELAWLDWSMDSAARDMLTATRRLIKVRRDFLAGQPESFLAIGGSSYLHWFAADGNAMTPEQWADPATRVLQMQMGSPTGVLDGLVVINAAVQDLKVVLPGAADDGGTTRRYELRFSTAQDYRHRRGIELLAGDKDLVEANSISVYRSQPPRD
ncbi:glycogen debranching protein GlgX [Paenarthrobacter sp. Z7-10]|nr:glycogen debranching protein GlgX [Paenarthrobacter sp. Z7-10]